MSEKFEQWCILEIMGHNRFAGLVSEQTIGGASFVRIDIPATKNGPAFTKMFGAGSIYCISPCTEEVARLMAESIRNQPLSVYDLPADIQAKIRQPALAGPGELWRDGERDDDIDDFYDGEDDE